MRRKKNYAKKHEADLEYGSVALGRFINYLMQDGKKAVAEKVLYGALNEIKAETKEEPLAVFERALDNASPLLEVVSKRVGGANYQVPREVRPGRKFFLGCKWIIDSARSGKGRPMHKKLAEELMAAAKNEGNAIKKKQNVHRMAEANRAFASYVR